MEENEEQRVKHLGLRERSMDMPMGVHSLDDDTL